MNLFITPHVAVNHACSTVCLQSPHQTEDQGKRTNAYNKMWKTNLFHCHTAVVPQFRPAVVIVFYKEKLSCGQTQKEKKNASGMHGVKKVKLNNIKRNSFKERN